MKYRKPNLLGVFYFKLKLLQPVTNLICLNTLTYMAKNKLQQGHRTVTSSDYAFFSFEITFISQNKNQLTFFYLLDHLPHLLCLWKEKENEWI